MLNQDQIPLLEQLDRCGSRTPHAPFYAPGHKRGVGISQYLTEVMGQSVFTVDLPELPELDNLYQPCGVIQQAQTLAAEAFGAQQTWFLVNGSTVGIIAAILATCNPGDKIIIPRNVHQSVISGLVLSGAQAIAIDPDYSTAWDLAYSITPEAIEQALNQHPDITAILIVYPTYEGICGDISRIAQIAHQYNIPLLVDEAHGPHFAFHPNLPLSALAAGADLTVQSTHKILGAMTMASMLHVQGDRINRSRLAQALQQVQSTSPSYLLLASLDAARHQMATMGEKLMSDTLKLAGVARRQLQQIPKISVFPTSSSPSLNPETTEKTTGFIDLDLTRLTVNISQLGLSGYEADEILHQHLGITAELPTLNCLTFIISLGNTQADIDQLIKGLTTLVNDCDRTSECMGHSPKIQLMSPTTLSVIDPRIAFFAPNIALRLSESIGYISAEQICPYPPGIPILIPGETITQERVNLLQTLLKLGATLTGCRNPTLETIHVVD
ncbi:MAG: aminotransferase class I/II-fold pyridoxal phosphate-dependent enzyme [Microcoleaceae cyanobacterium]